MSGSRRQDVGRRMQDSFKHVRWINIHCNLWRHSSRSLMKERLELGHCLRSLLLLEFQTRTEKSSGRLPCPGPAAAPLSLSGVRPLQTMGAWAAQGHLAGCNQSKCLPRYILPDLTESVVWGHVDKKKQLTQETWYTNCICCLVSKQMDEECGQECGKIKAQSIIEI